VEAKARALRKATRQFGGDFALVDFTKAFDSPDEDDILAIQQVSGVFGSLVNSLVQPTPAAVKLLGLKPTPGMRGQPGFIDAVSQDGGFGADQATTLISLYQTRNALEHGSPDMQADELHGQVKLLLRSYKGLVKSFVIWLARNDVHLDDD
jgi:hypothetical protein